jgi:serine/threonine protein kinase
MTPEPTDAADRERRRNQVLAVCLEDPVLAAEVAAFLADHEQLGGSLRRVADSPAASDAKTVFDPGFTKPRSFGAYELIAEIGRGGMGVVYKARQKGLNRFVALKMILAGNLAGADDQARFHTECQAVAALRHPNIVAVHEIGEAEGQLFCSMEFIEGLTLAHRLAEGPVPGRAAAAYVAQLARAIHHAHGLGILHRDLKPSNILIDQGDRPYITDFGLAKRLGATDPGLTRSGAIVGTPSYMSPEQAGGKTREFGPACDIWGLGAVLYEILTSRPPFRSDTPLDTLLLVLNTDPVPPRLLNPKVDGDLETICLKCLEKEAKGRYASAEDLAADLQRYLDGETIQARSYNLLARLTRALHKPSQREADLGTWATLLLVFSAIILVGHVLTFVLLQTNQPYRFVLMARASQLLLGGVAFWYCRRHSLLPANAAERQVWLIWLGALAAFATSSLVSRLLIDHSVLTAGPAAPASWREVVAYPYSAVVSGLAFFAMGGSYGARYYVISLAFFGLALVLPLALEWSPLAYGILWSLALVAVAWHLRRRGAELS